jgi:predicted NBD/HSP70 family sugar kinase
MICRMETAPLTADLSLMRELNQALILNLVRQEGQISRAEIAKRTNLSRSTVSNIINELIEADRIHEIQKGESRGGRRPILLELNYRSHCCIGIELSTTFLNLVITDLRAEILYQLNEPFDITTGPDLAVQHVEAVVGRAMQDAGIDPEKVTGVGIGVPGPITYTTGLTIAPPVMPGWNGVCLRDRFSEALPFPVYVDNDANLAALAEYRWGVAQQVRNIAYIYLGVTGIGAGLVLNGSIYRGEIGSAGEIGHFMIDEDGPLCSCGSHGCLEAIAGLPQMLRTAARLGNGQLQTLDQLIEEAHNNNHSIRDLFVKSGTHLGIAVANLLNLYNPGLVVLGGPLAAAQELLLETVRVTARKRALPISLEHCDIVAGKLGTDAVALGAAGQIIQSVFSPAALDTLVGQL